MIIRDSRTPKGRHEVSPPRPYDPLDLEPLIGLDSQELRESPRLSSSTGKAPAKRWS